MIGVASALAIASGIIVPLGVGMISPPPVTKARKAIAAANRRCPTIPALRPVGALPPATILTMVDFGPRLITLTHHSVIAGPYHRNEAAMLDVQHAFRTADPAVALGIMRRHDATYVLICPNMSETTLYAVENPDGFYARLRDGKVPSWLAPVALPKDSPFRLWRRTD